MRISLRILLMVSILNNYCVGQNSFYYPENPTWEDTITVICGVYLVSSPCDKLNADLSVQGMEYTAHLCHYEGLLAMPCSTNDTFRIKVPNNAPGNYTFYCELNLNQDYEPPFDSVCTVLAGVDTIHIPVSDPLSVSGPMAFEFQIIPNPTSDQAIIYSMTGNLHEIVLTDMLGKQLGRLPINRNQRLDLSSYKSGLYMVKVILDDGRQGVQRLMVQH